MAFIIGERHVAAIVCVLAEVSVAPSTWTAHPTFIQLIMLLNQIENNAAIPGACCRDKYRRRNLV